jgi:hypothetical protein
MIIGIFSSILIFSTAFAIFSSITFSLFFNATCFYIIENALYYPIGLTTGSGGAWKLSLSGTKPFV